MMKPARIFTIAAAAMFVSAAANANCDITYTTKTGDTLSTIAEAEYGDATKWALIYYGNQSKLKDTNSQISAGTDLRIPCSFKGLAPTYTPSQVESAEMKLLTGGNFPPFADRNWPGQGIATELLNAIMEETPSPVTYSITWEDDWSKHMFPLLDSKEFDMGFPWARPNCEKNPADAICQNFHFSESLLALPLMLYVRNDSTFAFVSDADIHGKTLCRPKGYTTYDLDRDGRDWLKNGLITLTTPDSPADCFGLLMKDQVDAVTFNAFLGNLTLKELGLTGEIKSLEKPLSLQSLHVIISKKHWRGTAHLYRINAGIAAIKESGRYSEIVSRQLSIFENSLKW